MGWVVTRGGRRPETPEHFRLVNLDRQPTCHWTAVTRAGERLAGRIIMGNGDYRSSVEAILVFADALVARPGS